MANEKGRFDKVVGTVAQTALARGQSFELILDWKEEDGTTAVNLTGHTVDIHSSHPAHWAADMSVAYTDRTAGRVTISLTAEQFERGKLGALQNWIKPRLTAPGGTNRTTPRLFLDMDS